MYLLKLEKGVGLVEVLVALLILSIGILGFATLQLRAVEASSEAYNRIAAMNIARDLAEKIRVNSGLNGDVIASYQTELSGGLNKQNTFATNCFTSFCNAVAKADFDVSQSAAAATALGMVLNMTVCPSAVNDKRCIYVAWGKTKATNVSSSAATGTIETACTVSQEDGFRYVNNSTCTVMEVL
ncbi:hypothetical protein GCM10027155_17830 [Acinetobacter apis]|uniref:Type IV pilus assembly protein PilV n=1 Tax=Acinetobacter apis TaxID=1229165 RepID=A0A217EG51_9GAMM|nr:type IV pilus modification protein PilV [Acinetobacter apis]SNQ29479.1 type IV pilus assembly protein PilV [Acinetobacter apis]